MTQDFFAFAFLQLLLNFFSLLVVSLEVSCIPQPLISFTNKTGLKHFSWEVLSILPSYVNSVEPCIRVQARNIERPKSHV